MAEDQECYDYVAWRDGFVVAVCVDDPKWKKDTARSIAEWVRKGCTIERMTHSQFNEIPREKLFKRKPKAEPQLVLFTPTPEAK